MIDPMPCNEPNPACVSDEQEILRPGRLHNQSEAALRRRLAEEPRDTGALLRLGDLHRQRGNFPAASEAYGRLCVLRPGDRRALWLRAVTAGEQLPATPPDGVHATPFVRIRDFLSHDEREHLLSAALAMRGLFASGRVGYGAHCKIKTLERRALVANLSSRADVCAWLVPKLREVLPEVFMLLRIDGFDQCRMSRLSMVAHPDGGFSACHNDFLIPLLCICYFHRTSSPFTGGDLLLRDTEVDTGRYGGIFEFSRIEPAADSIVFYPGAYMHEVTPVACEPNDFTTARFSVTVGFWPRIA